MTPINRTPFTGTLPDSFFVETGHRAAGYQPDGQPERVRALFGIESARNEIILYTTQHPAFRLVGMFPRDGSDALFGYWHTSDEVALNQRAFGLLEADARQRGHTGLIGPMNFNTFHPYRLRLTPAPSWHQFDREPANSAYYPGLLTQLGFQIKSRFESRLLTPDAIPVAYQTKEPLLAGLAQMPFDFIPLTPNAWAAHETELFALVHQIFETNPAYTPIPQAEFDLLYNRAFARQLCPYSSVLLRDRASGRLVGLSLCQPNYQSLPFAPGETPDFRRDYPRLHHRVLLVKTVGVHPDFRNQGLMSGLGAYGMGRFRDGYDAVIFCLMRSDNFSRHFSDGLAFERAEYALFEKPLSR